MKDHDKTREQLIAENLELDNGSPPWKTVTGNVGRPSRNWRKAGHPHDRYPICALRLTGVYGAARPIENSRRFDLIRAVVRSETVTCQRGGNEVHAGDVAKAVGIPDVIFLLQQLAAEKERKA